jgi:hypothetical protein
MSVMDKVECLSLEGETPGYSCQERHSFSEFTGIAGSCSEEVQMVIAHVVEEEPKRRGKCTGLPREEKRISKIF